MQTTTAPTDAEENTDSTPLRVGIQGYAGAFHHIASQNYFAPSPIEIVPAHTFEDLITNVSAGETMDTALMAIENTLYGSITPNYQLLLASDLYVTGEVFLHVEQNLMALPGSKIEDLEEVHSHPVAIAQCEPFFKKYPHIRLVENADTALSAKEVREKKQGKIGAIASHLAADLYELEILNRSIETNKKNHTRFWVLERDDVQVKPNANKVSISLTLGHEVGSLHKVLAILAAYNVNLTKIQSAPIIGSPWEYRFFIDFVAHETISAKQALEGIRPIIKEMRIFGIYPAGKKI